MSAIFDKMRDFFMGYDEYEDEYDEVEESIVDIEPMVIEPRRGGIRLLTNPKS